MAGHVGSESAASNGVSQGCPLSAQPLHEHMGQICEDSDGRSNA